MHAKLSFFEQRFHYRMTVCFVETVLEVVVALRQDNKNGFSKHMWQMVPQNKRRLLWLASMMMITH